VDTLHPRVSVWLGGKSLEHWGLRRFLTSVSVSRVLDRTEPTSDKPKGRAKRSSASITLQNPDNQIVDQMAIKEDLEIWLGYGSDMYHRGSFLVVQPSVTWPNAAASSISLKAEDYAAEMLGNDALVRTFGDPANPSSVAGLDEVVKTIANSYGMDHEVEESIGKLQLFNTCKMRGETDWDFLERILKTTSTGFMYVDTSPPESGSGKRHVLKVQPFTAATDLIQDNGKTLTMGYRDYRADLHLASAKVSMQGLKADQFAGSSKGDGGQTLLVGAGGAPSEIFLTKPGGEGIAGDESSTVSGVGGERKVDLPVGPLSLSQFREAIDLWLDFKLKITATLSPAVPYLYPGYIVQLLGLGPFSGRALLTSVQDKWGASGYTQTLELRSADWMSGQAGESDKKTGTTLLVGATGAPSEVFISPASGP